MWMYSGERPELSKLPADLERLTDQYAQKMRHLYAVLSEMYGGGPGVEKIDQVLADVVKARDAVYTKLRAMIHDNPDEPQDAFVRAEEAVRYQLLDALVLALPPDPVINTGKSFEENEVKITKQAAKLTAHRLKNLINLERARGPLRETIAMVGDYETRRKSSPPSRRKGG